MIRETLPRSPYLAKTCPEAPVGLVIVRAGGRANAMTVSFFSEVAHHPTSMWISIERSTQTHSLLLEAGAFSFVTLERKQAAIALECGFHSGRDRDKCKTLPLYDNGGGFLFLRDAIASTACRIERTVPLGAHTLFIAHILSGDAQSARRPLRNLLLSDLQAL